MGVAHIRHEVMYGGIDHRPRVSIKRAGFFIAGQHVGRGFIPIRKKEG
jgi:hypothetical protein